MIATVFALLVAYWFYRSAAQADKPTMRWIAIGLISYYATLHIWSSLIMKPLIPRAFDAHSVGGSLIVEISAVALGIAVVAAIRMRYLR